MKYAICLGPMKYDENYHLCRDGKFVMGFSFFGKHSGKSTLLYSRKGNAEAKLKRMQKRDPYFNKSFIKDIP